MSDADRGAQALEGALAAAGIDPAGLDLAWLARLKAETEAMIDAGRREPGFGDAVPAWNPPARLAAEGGRDDAA